jgi:dihydrofolate reductase
VAAPAPEGASSRAARPLLTAVVAVAENGTIGRAGGLPWHLPADLAHFKAMTLGRPILMGRRTFDSIGRALPGRRNLVVTRRPLDVPGVEAVASVEEALQRCAGEPEVAVIGGAQLYETTMPITGRVHLTLVHADVEGDTFLPEFPPEEWVETSRVHRPADERNAYAMSFITLERR